MARARAVDDSQIVDLMESAGMPLSAYDLISRLPRTQRPSPPVIYRALDRLSSEGRVHRIESLKAFIPCRSHGHSHEVVFAVCLDCNQVEEIEDHGLCGVVSRWQKSSGFSADQKTFEIVGHCEDCRSQH
ncbi:MAG: Fur family transcriptional regulator [Rhodospirillaceae bacterium]|nr:Fur family transcriptional regulator [Rhodospirillaceae bacterium]